MKKQYKGLFFVVLFGGGLLFWATASSMPGISPMDGGRGSSMTITGTPADNFPDDQRGQFCGSGIAQSTDFVQEYLIPTACTNPLAIVTDYDGNVWFTQTNTGKVAKFDPANETFTEYSNPLWPEGVRSMMWGIDYAPDGSVWFTDEMFDSIWKFSTIDERYERLSYPSEGNSLPQRLLVDGSQIIVNDFTGNKITFLDPTTVQSGEEEANHIVLPSPIDNYVTGDFAVDADDNIWYTNWLLQYDGVLVKFDQSGYRDMVAVTGDQFLPLDNFVRLYSLPSEMLTPNGIAVDMNGLIWIADTSTSFFFSFDPSTGRFTQYVTADPRSETYGNQTGIVRDPISRPYWIDVDDQGRIIFNAQTANTIAVMDPKSQSLVEYQVPSKNPYWADCDLGIGMMIADCGLAQVFDFAVDGDKIWFTEWVENNIGVVDTSIPLPLELQLGSEAMFLSGGKTEHANVLVYPRTSSDPVGASVILSTTHDFLKTNLAHGSTKEFQLDSDLPQTIHFDVMATEDAVPGTYKILVGVQTSDVAVGKFVTVIIQ